MEKLLLAHILLIGGIGGVYFDLIELIILKEFHEFCDTTYLLYKCSMYM